MDQYERGKIPSHSVGTMLFAALASFIAAIEIAYFRIACLQLHAGNTDPDGFADGLFAPGTLLVIVVLTIVFSALAWLLMRFDKRVFHWGFKYRYIIAGVLLVILVACKISGSSIGMLTNMLGGEAGDYLGVMRNIRRDEWVVNTPLVLSQVQSGFAPVSPLASGGGLDLTLVYAQPCWDISTLFRPFLWGYLLLGAERGLSFFWCARLICLFMVSFEFGRLLTKDNRRLALIYAMLMAFSPLVEWWFAVNSIAEILIFSQLFILLFAKFLSTDKWPMLVLSVLGLAYCACAYVLGLYPAWQIPVIYIMVCMCAALLVKYIRSGRGKRSIIIHAILFIGAIALAVAFALVVVLHSYGTISAVMGSEYPGSRLETGGGLFDSLFTYSLILYAIIDPTPILPNVCEMMGMYGLFPLGIILGAVFAVKRRDGFVIALLIVDFIFLVFGLFGFPPMLAKISLLSNVTAHRLAFGVGIIDIMLLIRSLSLALSNVREPRPLSVPAALSAALAGVVLGAAAVMLTRAHVVPSMRIFVIVISTTFIALSVYAVLSTILKNDISCQRVLCVSALVMLTGLMVNPVQIGLSNFYETPLSSAVAHIKDNSTEELWVADDSIIAQACIAYGVPTLNSVALYPHVDVWKPVDSEGKFKSIYNRYAHIKIRPTRGEATFELEAADSFTASLNTRDLKALGIDYWVSEFDLSQYSDDVVQFENVADAGERNVYHLRYM